MTTAPRAPSTCRSSGSSGSSSSCSRSTSPCGAEVRLWLPSLAAVLDTLVLDESAALRTTLSASPS
ncbi:hypothetical protein G5V59_21040 [Nocardioides sp. W3-2-3]|nr:hypothetical protein [Nocardioides convexus]